MYPLFSRFAWLSGFVAAGFGFGCGSETGNPPAPMVLTTTGGAATGGSSSMVAGGGQGAGGSGSTAGGSAGASGAPTGGGGAASAGSANAGASTGGAPQCPEGQSPCESGCANTQLDAANCGMCGRACASTEMCVAGQCMPNCPQGQTDCSGTCADLSTNHDHCGDCTLACGAEQMCVAGDCVCPAGESDCQGSCVDLATDNANCGACGVACVGGRTCQPAGCACPMGQTECGESCFDLETDEAHCGDCALACGEGMTCEAGDCVCGEELTECPNGCFDLASDGANCGECGRACSNGETCNAGGCGGGVGEDDCMGLAQNVSLEAVAVYQGVEVPIMETGAEIVAASRNADVVAGRLAVFRVFVTVGDGWAARQLSARLHIANGDDVQTHFTKLTVSGDSAPDDLGSTFQIEVPAQEITTTTRYAVELVECATGSGEAASPRFPEAEDLPLGARTTGVIKVRFVPIRTHLELDEPLVPDTSPATLDRYRSWLMAMLPVTGVEFTVDDPWDVDEFSDWGGHLYDLAYLRADRNVPADEYFYGLVMPEETFFEYCSGSCTAGIGFVVPNGNQNADSRVAIGIGYTDDMDYVDISATTMVHELGHNQGREHAPCGGPAEPDQNYPYDGGEIGVIGYDYRDQTFLGTDNTDIMGYCDARWISDYTYDAVLARVASVNGNPLTAMIGAQGTFHVLSLSPSGPLWKRPIDQPRWPVGTPESAEILDAAGNVVASIEVYRTNIGDMDAAMIWVPTPRPGWHAVRVAGVAPVPFLTATAP